MPPRRAVLPGAPTRPERAEHHYRYDPDKSVAYLATTLAWVGDPAAESCAREVIATLGTGERGRGGSRWPTSTSPWRCW